METKREKNVFLFILKVFFFLCKNLSINPSLPDRIPREIVIVVLTMDSALNLVDVSLGKWSQLLCSFVLHLIHPSRPPEVTLFSIKIGAIDVYRKRTVFGMI